MVNKKNIKDIFKKGKVIPNKNPNTNRMDKFGNEIYLHSYGKNTPMGWDVDHSKPISKGGTNHMNNLQPLQKKANQRKSNEYPVKDKAKLKI